MRKLLLASLAIIVVASAAAIWHGWAPDRSVESLSERWAPAPSQFIEVAGLRVHVRDEGRADSDQTPLVLLHGTSASLHTWDGWVAALASERRIIRFDMPGFGLTGPVADNDYRIARYVNTTFAVMDALGIPRAVIAGNSLGGQIALEAALAQPERVAGLVLVDSGGYPFAPESMPIGFRLAQISWLKPVTTRLLPRYMVAASVYDVYGDPSRVTPELIDRYYELTLRAGNRAALAERMSQLGPSEDIRARVAALTQPTLLMWGDQDRLIPPAVGKQMHQDIPGSSWVSFADLGHVPQEEDAERTAAAAAAFLQRQQL